MVQIASFALAIAAAATGVSAYTAPCVPGTVRCGFALNNSTWGYTREELISALEFAGQDPLNPPNKPYDSLFYCVDRFGTISFDGYCGDHKCTEPNPAFPGPDSSCKP
ncbi:hypothetical protein LIA77_11719 [Sarocladium implicatum]|nr:hypothetical protein LIA77_11719 [Sarocladium implicatum]